MISVDLLLLTGMGLWVSIIDARSFRIPDQAIGLGFVLICVLAITGGLEAPDALIGMILALVQMGAARWISHGCLGLGDVKYALFLGSLLGPIAWLITSFITALFALIMSIPSLIELRRSRKDRIPLAPYMTCAALATRILMGMT